VLTSRDIIKVSRFIADLVLRPSPGMIPRVIRLDPREAIRLSISGLGSGELLLMSFDSVSGEEGSSSSGGGIAVGIRERRGIVVVEAKTFEDISHVLVSISTVDSAGISSSDRLRGIIRIFMLSSWDIIQVSRLIADLVLRPCPSMISWVIRFDP
jgi:hypothetical protein